MGCTTKAYKRPPREELWHCIRKSRVTEKYVRVVHDMYKGSMTAVRCAVGITDGFQGKVGVHRGSSLNPFLLALAMDSLTKEFRQQLHGPWYLQMTL